MKLSVIIPTLNEEQDIPHCLRSVKDIADEIIVVDSGSTDRTVEIAQNFGVTVAYHAFENFSDTRNFGDDLATGDWILSIEADVIVPGKLSQEIKLALNTNADAFMIPRLNQIWGKDIYHTDWGPAEDTHIWLYRKGSGEWQGSVHEEYKTKGNIGNLANHLYHHNYDTISEFIQKLNKYSDTASLGVVKTDRYAPIYDFLKRYIWKQGFSDGYHGLFLSYLQAIYHLTLLVKNKTNK